MKTTAFITLVTVITTSTMHAQQNNDSLLSTHELAIDTRSLLVAAMGADDKYPQFGLTYKYSPRGTSAYRLGFRLMTSTTPNSYLTQLNLDSVLVKESYSGYFNYGIQGSAGYEWIRGKKKVKRFYGADIAYMRYTHKTSHGKQYYPADTCSTCPPAFSYAPDPVRSYSEAITSTINRFQLSLFYGVKCPLAKKFWISAQAGFGVMYETGESRGTFSNNAPTASYRFSNLALAAMPVINDVSLVYLF